MNVGMATVVRPTGKGARRTAKTRIVSTATAEKTRARSTSFCGVHTSSTVPPDAGTAQPFAKPKRAPERQLDRNLLIEQHADQQREGIGVDEIVDLGFAGDPEGAMAHDGLLSGRSRSRPCRGGPGRGGSDRYRTS